MKEKAAALLSYIDAEWKTIEKLKAKLQGKIEDSGRTAKPLTEEDAVFCGYQLHNLYCAFEELFTSIAKTFENSIGGAAGYHADMLKTMAMDIYKTRPRFVSDESFGVLNEIRKFRHVYRHGYEYDLDPERVLSLSRMVTGRWDRLVSDKDLFREFLIALAEQ